MSVAVIQGASGGQASALIAHILKNTGLRVYALTSGKGKALEDRLSEGPGGGGGGGRLTVLDGIDLREEGGLEKAASTLKEREGKAAVRLIACFAGILQPEKSLGALDIKTISDTFQINSIGHLLTYKHFVPLLPSKKEWKDVSKGWESNGDPAKGLVHGDNSLCWSMSARVGSIGGNEKGGWYSYRSSKAALNQIIRTLDHELVNKSSSGVAVSYHPGTVLTSFSKSVVGKDAKPDPEHGRFDKDQALEKMISLMSKVSRGEGAQGDGKWGGGFFDWKGERVEW